MLAQEQEEEAQDLVEEIIVTARKRDENLQDVPSSVQAIREDMLKQIGALHIEDYARLIPSMTWIEFSQAGSNYISFRGITTGTDDFVAQASASVYLDEVSVTQTGAQPNVRTMDINRVEALSGPQGTLYGAAAQAGTLRVYSNQPDTTKFESSVDTNFRSGPESAMSHAVTGVLNVPLVEDVFAIRIAAQTGTDGGYIDNVLGHTPDGWYGYSVNSGERAAWGTLDNSSVVEDNWNSVESLATRIQARWNINEDWSATLGHNYSVQEAQGANDYNPYVGDLETIAFNNNYRQDEWDLFSLTVRGDLGFAQFVSATSFFDRQYDYSLDGTVYFKYYHSWGLREPLRHFLLLLALGEPRYGLRGVLPAVLHHARRSRPARRLPGRHRRPLLERQVRPGTAYFEPGRNVRLAARLLLRGEQRQLGLGVDEVVVPRLPGHGLAEVLRRPVRPIVPQRRIRLPVHRPDQLENRRRCSAN